MSAAGLSGDGCASAPKADRRICVFPADANFEAGRIRLKNKRRGGRRGEDTKARASVIAPTVPGRTNDVQRSRRIICESLRCHLCEPRANLTEFVSFPDRRRAVAAAAMLYQCRGALYARICWLHGKRERDKERNVILCSEAGVDALFFQCQDD